MRHPQLVIYEADGKLAGTLRPVIDQRKWVLREPRLPAACLEELRRGGPTVLVLKVGRDLERELRLLGQATWHFPDAPAVVVGDLDHAPLAGLAWDLGASFVLFPPFPRDRLPDVVVGLMGLDPPSAGSGAADDATR